MVESEMESSIQSDPPIEYLATNQTEIDKKKVVQEMCGAEMKKDNICRINIYSNCEDEGQIIGLSYMLVAGNKKHSDGWNNKWVLM